MAVYPKKPTASSSVEPVSLAPSLAGGGSVESGVSRRVTVIEPKKGWTGLDLADIWAYRDLLLTFAQRDVKLRYRQTALGAIWVVAQPLLASVIFTVVFGMLAKGTLPSYGLPYFMIVLTGQIGWLAFSNTVTKANMSLVQNANLVSKIYFPRLVLPLSIVMSTLVDFGITLLAVLIMMAVYHIVPTITFLLMPVFLLLILMLAVGIGLFTAALTVQYRDVQYVIPIAMNFVMYAAPVNYDVPKDAGRFLSIFFGLNPLTPLMQGMRWSLLGVTPPPNLWGVVYVTVVALLALVGGAYSFRKMERRFADVI